MSDSPKKLTVSFGAFSCTLAGFDDPFPIMRQVVDYFQQLAERDPSFGAHPERPNTETLRAIAEARTGAPVEAEMNGDEVVLRQTVSEEPGVSDAQPAISAKDPEPVMEEPGPASDDTDPVMEDPAPDVEENDPGLEMSDPVELEPETAQEELMDLSAATQDVSPAAETFDLIDRDDLWAAMDTDPLEEIGFDDSTAPQFEDVEDVDAFDDDDFAPEPDPSLAEAAAAICAPIADDDPIIEEEPVMFVADEKAAEPDQVALAAQNWTPPHSTPLSAAETASAIDLAAVEAAVAQVCAAATAELDQTLSAPEPVEEADTSIGADDMALPASDLSVWVAEFEDYTAEEMREEQDFSYSEETAGAEHFETVFECAAPEETLVERTDHSQAAADEQWDVQADESAASDDTPDQEDEALERILAALRRAKGVTEPLEVQAPEASHATVRLGFGGDAGLDATHDDIQTEFVDQHKRDEDMAFDAMLGGTSDNDAEFAYTAPEPAPAPEPLVLTAAQRVDSAPAMVNPIDDVNSGHATTAETSDLRNFARGVGAASVSELIEASAAYVTMVNGRPNFSRREVLGMLDELAEDKPLTLETRIKTFGSLLRVGRLKRTDNGEFELSGDALTQLEQRRSA